MIPKRARISKSHTHTQEERTTTPLGYFVAKKVAETSLSLNRAWPSDGKNSHGRNSRAAAETQDKEEMRIQRTSEDDTQRQEPPVTNALTYSAGNGRGEERKKECVPVKARD